MPSNPPPPDRVGPVELPDLPPWPVEMWKDYENSRQEVQKFGSSTIWCQNGLAGETYHQNILEAGQDPDMQFKVVTQIVDAGLVPGMKELMVIKYQDTGTKPDKTYINEIQS